MLDDAFAYLKGKIQAGKVGIALLKLFHDVQGMQVVIKTVAVLTHRRIQGLFPRMAKGWVADVVGQGQSLYKILIQFQLSRDRAGDLCDLNGMRKTIEKMILVAAAEGPVLMLRGPGRGGC